jgi:hypothetical protein
MKATVSSGNLLSGGSTPHYLPLHRNGVERERQPPRGTSQGLERQPNLNITKPP